MKLMRLGWLAAAAGVFAACEQGQDPVGVEEQFPIAAVAVPNVGVNNVIVCKEGPTGFTYNFSVTANTGSINVTPSVNLVDDGCSTVATATAQAQNITVVENGPPAGTLFDKVELYRFTSVGGLQSGPPVLISTSLNPSITIGPVGNDFGYVAVYTNINAPSTGCTLTQGYWKTHNASFGGGAPVDDTWELIGPLAEDEPFFLSGQTYFEVMWTAPAGNAYYQLAHQYIAAILNKLAGSGSTAAVDQAISDATTLFNTYTPAQIAALSKQSALRGQFLTLAGTLGSFNEGDIGPGHCAD